MHSHQKCCFCIGITTLIIIFPLLFFLCYVIGGGFSDEHNDIWLFQEVSLSYCIHESDVLKYYEENHENPDTYYLLHRVNE